MKLSEPFVQLPLSFDAQTMAAEVAALGEAAWRPHPQGFAGNSMLPLIAVGGDATNEQFSGHMLPTPELTRCPYLIQVLASFGATLGRTRLMRLAGQAEVTRHVDQGYYWAERVRVHVPIVTQPSVRFDCGDASIHMAEGTCWIFDTWRPHRVRNDASQSRIPLVAHTTGGSKFWQLVARGRPARLAGDGSWQTQMFRPESPCPQLALEAINVPVVMSPWEVEAHLRLILEEALPHPQLKGLEGVGRQFVLTWRGLWARYGEAPEGREEYSIALHEFLSKIEAPGKQVPLRNGITYLSAVISLIGKMAVT